MKVVQNFTDAQGTLFIDRKSSVFSFSYCGDVAGEEKIENNNGDPFELNSCSVRTGLTLDKSYPIQAEKELWLRSLLLLWMAPYFAKLELFGSFSGWKPLKMQELFNKPCAEKIRELFPVVLESTPTLHSWVREYIEEFISVYDGVLKSELHEDPLADTDVYKFFDMIRIEGMYRVFNSTNAILTVSQPVLEEAQRVFSPRNRNSRPSSRAQTPIHSRSGSVAPFNITLASSNLKHFSNSPRSDSIIVRNSSPLPFRKQLHIDTSSPEETTGTSESALKEEIKVLKELCSQLQESNRQLTKAVASLKSEILSLKHDNTFFRKEITEIKEGRGSAEGDDLIHGSDVCARVDQLEKRLREFERTVEKQREIFYTHTLKDELRSLHTEIASMKLVQQKTFALSARKTFEKIEKQ